MLADDNRTKATAAYEGFMQGDLEPLISILAEDVEWHAHTPPDEPLSGRYAGPEGVRDYLGRVQSETEITKFEMTDLIAGGDKVVGIFEIASVHKETGKKFDGRAIHVHTYNAQGKLARFEIFRQP